MESFVQTHEAAIRLSASIGIFALMALRELAAPRRALTVFRAVRRGNNLGLVVVTPDMHRVHHSPARCSPWPAGPFSAPFGAPSTAWVGRQPARHSPS